MDFIPKANDADSSLMPLVNFMEIIREDAENLPTAESILKPLDPPQARALLEAARSRFEQKEVKEALALYHTLFEAQAPVEVKVAVLEDLALIASPESLDPIKQYWARDRSILTHYKSADPRVLNSTAKVCLAIVDSLKAKDKERAKEALEKLGGILPNLSDPEIKRECLAKSGYIVHWRLLGPIPWDQNEESLEDVFHALKPLALQQPYRAGEKPLLWKTWDASEPRIDLEQALGQHNHVSAYGHAEIDLDEEKELYLNIGSDDGFKCWFNGELAGGYSQPRGWKLNDTLIRVKGRKGNNTLLIAIIEQTGDWAFSVKITDSLGFPITL
jgi:hypothetical protein